MSTRFISQQPLAQIFQRDKPHFRANIVTFSVTHADVDSGHLRFEGANVHMGRGHLRFGGECLCVAKYFAHAYLLTRLGGANDAERRCL